MSINIKMTFLLSAGLAVIFGAVSVARVEAAHGLPDDPTPVSIDGVVTDHGNPVVGKVIVAWCGDISHFGGTTRTDANGHFLINSDSVNCPLGADLAATAYNEDDPSQIDGVAHAIVHTQTTVNIRLGETNPIPVPEYGWATAIASTAIGGTAIALIRRRLSPQA